MSLRGEAEESATGEGQPLALYAWHKGRSKRLPLTDRVALAAKVGGCETRSPLPFAKERRGDEGPTTGDQYTTTLLIDLPSRIRSNPL